MRLKSRWSRRRRNVATLFVTLVLAAGGLTTNAESASAFPIGKCYPRTVSMTAWDIFNGEYLAHSYVFSTSANSPCSDVNVRLAKVKPGAKSARLYLRFVYKCGNTWCGSDSSHYGRLINKSSTYTVLLKNVQPNWHFWLESPDPYVVVNTYT